MGKILIIIFITINLFSCDLDDSNKVIDTFVAQNERVQAITNDYSSFGAVFYVNLEHENETQSSFDSEIIGEDFIHLMNYRNLEINLENQIEGVIIELYKDGSKISEISKGHNLIAVEEGKYSFKLRNLDTVSKHIFLQPNLDKITELQIDSDLNKSNYLVFKENICTSCDFDNSDFSYLSFNSINLDGSSFRYADFSNTSFTNSRINNAVFFNLNLDSSQIFSSTLNYVSNSRYFSLRNSKIVSSELIELYAEFGDIENSEFENVDMSNSHFNKGNVYISTFKNCKLVNSDFKNTYARFMSIEDSDLSGANFCQADTTGIKLINITANSETKCLKLLEQH